MSGDLVELAQRFVRLSGELDATRDAMKRLLMNGGASPNPTPAKRPGVKRPPAQAEEAILNLLQSSPGLRTAAIMKATGCVRSTMVERLKRLQAKGLIERDDAGVG
jgi:MarR family